MLLAYLLAGDAQTKPLLDEVQDLTVTGLAQLGVERGPIRRRCLARRLEDVVAQDLESGFL